MSQVGSEIVRWEMSYIPQSGLTVFSCCSRVNYDRARVVLLMLPRRSGETEWIRSRQTGRAHQSQRTHSAKTVATASAPTATQLSERLTKRRQIGWSWDSGATQRRSLTRWRICHHHWPDSPRHLPVSNQADSAFHPFGVDKWVEAAIRCPPHQYVEAPSGDHLRDKGRH